jgi:hypothetical protein
MPPEKLNPVTLGADRARNSFNVLATLNVFENSSLPTEINARRAAWLARRFAVPSSMAETISALAFGEGQR